MKYEILGIFGQFKKISFNIAKLIGVEWTFSVDLRDKLRKGDFKSKFPFGLLKMDGTYYVLLLEKSIDFSDSICIGDYQFMIDNELFDVDFDYKDREHTDGFYDYILTETYLYFSTIDFIKPNEVKSFLNRFSKNVMSKRNFPIKEKEFNFEISPTEVLKRKFVLYEALSIKIHEGPEEGSILLTLFPRHEIMEDGLAFPFDHPLYEELQEEWKQDIKWDGTKLKKTGIQLIETLFKHLKKLSY